MKLFFHTIPFLIVFIFTISTAKAQEEHQIDEKLDQCLEADPTTFGMCNCISTAMEEWDSELNKYYKLLIAELKPETAKKLKESQRKWLAFRDAEYEYITDFYGEMEGSMFKIFLLESKKRIVKQRTLHLKSYYDDIHMDE